MTDVSTELRLMEASIRNDIIEDEVHKRRCLAIDTNNKMKQVFESWFGHTAEDIFSYWKMVMIQSKQQRYKDETEHDSQIKRTNEEEVEKLALATKEV